MERKTLYMGLMASFNYIREDLDVDNLELVANLRISFINSDDSTNEITTSATGVICPIINGGHSDSKYDINMDHDELISFYVNAVEPKFRDFTTTTSLVLTPHSEFVIDNPHGGTDDYKYLSISSHAMNIDMLMYEVYDAWTEGEMDRYSAICRLIGEAYRRNPLGVNVVVRVRYGEMPVKETKRRERIRDHSHDARLQDRIDYLKDEITPRWRDTPKSRPDITSPSGFIGKLGLNHDVETGETAATDSVCEPEHTRPSVIGNQPKLTDDEISQQIEEKFAAMTKSMNATPPIANTVLGQTVANTEPMTSSKLPQVPDATTIPIAFVKSADTSTTVESDKSEQDGSDK